MHGAIEAWGSFYVIVGSAAGGLTGLQFVVMTLIAQTAPSRSRGETISAFGTPNVVHFCAALLVAAILSVPWGALRAAGLAIAACGVLGVIYSVIVVRRAHRQRDYQPVFEDWLWHTMLPFLAYAGLFLAGAMLGPASADALFVIGGATLLLVFIGIHNAWDTVTFMMMDQAARTQGTEPAGPPRSGAGPASGTGTGTASVPPRPPESQPPSVGS